MQEPQQLHQECPKLQQTRERDTGEAQLSGGTGGQLLTAKPVTGPDSARATNPRETETVLELRLGARFGSGTGERDQERALEEAAVVTAARGRAVAASWLDSSRKDVEDAAGGAVVAAKAACEPAAVPALPPRTLEMPTAPESSSSASTVSWAASRRRSSPRDMVTQKARQRAPKKRGSCADKDRSRCSEKGSARTKPLGRQRGKLPGRP